MGMWAPVLKPGLIITGSGEFAKLCIVPPFLSPSIDFFVGFG